MQNERPSWVRELHRSLKQMLIPDTAQQQEIVALKRLIAQSRSPALFNNEDDFLTERLLAHPITRPWPQIKLARCPPNNGFDRQRIAKRLLTAYQKAVESELYATMKREGEDLWSELVRNELPELVAIIEHDDHVALSSYLKSFGDSHVWFGGITTGVDGFTRNNNPDHIALVYYDKLVCLAESLGLIRVESPESGPWGENIYIVLPQLIENIEEHLGICIVPPSGVIHTDGLDTTKGPLHYRHINALYSATRVQTLCTQHDAVCEFGGGLGLTAFYLRKLGFDNYTILDLPITLLLAGHFLLHACGEEAVTLYGESATPNTVKLLPYWECVNLPDNHFTLCLNQDSMPEISDNLVFGYLDQIKRIGRSRFLSINHECFFPRTVLRFVKRSKGFTPLYRAKCWTREGYVEELFEIARQETPRPFAGS